MGKNSGHNDGNHDKRQAEKAKAAAAIAAPAPVVDVANTLGGSGTTANTYNAARDTIGAPSSVNNTYNPSRSYTEVGPIRPEAFSAGLSTKFNGKFNLPTTTLNGASEGELELMLTTLGKSMDYEMEYGITELNGEIQRNLAKMQYENEQLGLDKQIDNSIWLDRTKNIAANRQQREMTNAQILSNL